jgi:hypothetical protein
MLSNAFFFRERLALRRAACLALANIADEILDHRWTRGPAQNVFLLLEQEFLADQGATPLHLTVLKSGARELKLDFLKAVLRGYNAQLSTAA